MATKAWKLRVLASDDSTLDFEITDANLADAPTIGGQRIDVLGGRTETVEWSFSVMEGASEFFTSQLADANDRSHLGGRLVDVQLNKDGAGFNTVAKARISRISETTGPGRYTVYLADERWIERGSTLFEVGDTTSLFPRGVVVDWNRYNGRNNYGNAAQWEVVQLQSGGNDVLLRHRITNRVRMREAERDFLLEDVKRDATKAHSVGDVGNFTHMRIHLLALGADREIVSLNRDVTDSALPDVVDVDGDTEQFWEYVWVAWGATSQPSVGDIVRGYIYAPTVPTSEQWPKHVGGVNGTDPIAYLKTLYQDAGIRIDTTEAFAQYDATTNPLGLVGHPAISPMLWRVTSPANMAQWVEENIYGPLFLVPYVDEQGQISPRSMFMGQGLDPDTFTVVNEDDVSDHPTWVHEPIDAVTRLRFRYRRHPKLAHDDDASFDGFRTEEVELPARDNDRVGDLGIHERVIDMPGIASLEGTGQTRTGALWLADVLEEEIFNRFGDGPIRGTFPGMDGLDALRPGDWVKLSLTHYPNLVGSTRGGTRIVQIVGKDITPAGPVFDYLDAGPDDQPLATPTTAIAQNASEPRFSVDVTLSNLAAGATWELFIKVGSDQWQAYGTGTSNTTVTVSRLPSGTTIKARAKAVKAGRISSEFSAEASVATQTLTAPSSLSVTVNGGQIILTWTNGESDVGIRPDLNGNFVTPDPLPAGTTRWVFQTNSSAQQTLGVRHVDPYGGESARATANATPTTKGQLRSPTEAWLLQGEMEDVPAYPKNPAHGVGVEWGVARENPLAELLVQWDTDHLFTNPQERVFGGDRALVQLPPDGVRRYFRFRLIQEGWTNSAVRTGFSAIPVPLREVPPENVNLNVLHEVRPEWVYDRTNDVYYLDLHIRPGDRVVACAIQGLSGGVDDYEFDLTSQGTPETVRLQAADQDGVITGDATFAATDDVSFHIVAKDSSAQLNSAVNRGNQGPLVKVVAGTPSVGTFGALRVDLHTKSYNAASSISGNWTPNFNNGAEQYGFTLSGNATLQVPSNFAPGDTMILEVNLNGHTLSFATNTFFSDGNITKNDLTGIVSMALQYRSTGVIRVGILNNLTAL